MGDYVLVTIVSNNCPHCAELLKIWNNVTNELLKVYPSLRFPVSTIETKQYKYPPIMIHNKNLNTNLFPKDLLVYEKYWTPIVLLIPSASWDKCNEKLGPNNHTTLENVYIMNSTIVNGKLTPIPIYNTKDPVQFGVWLKDTLNNIQIITKLPTKTVDDNVCFNIYHNLISR
jgi:hypothetical protein